MTRKTGIAAYSLALTENSKGPGEQGPAEAGKRDAAEQPHEWRLRDNGEGAEDAEVHQQHAGQSAPIDMMCSALTIG